VSLTYRGHKRDVYKRQPDMMIAINRPSLSMINMSSFGERIRERLDILSIDQAELARATDLSPQRLNNYVQGRRPPDVDSLVRIAKALRVSTDSLLGLSDVPSVDIEALFQRVLEYDGMSEARAAVIAKTASQAVQLLYSFPDEGDARSRAHFAAHAAWQAKPPSAPN